MADIIETPRRRIDYGALGSMIAQPFQQQQNQQRELQNTLMGLVFKSQLEKQAKLDELALRMDYAAKIRKELMDGGNGPLGDYKMELDEWGLPKSYSQKSPAEKLAEKTAQESQSLSSVLPTFSKYALHEAGTQEPGIATQRIGQLQSKLTSKYPTQMDVIKNVIGGLTPPKTGGKQSLNPTNLARGMAQMFKNTESAFPESSSNPALQRLATLYGLGPLLSTKTGIGTTAKKTGEITTQKIRARSFLKNFENNRFTDKDIEQAVAGMTNPTLTSAERLGVVVNTVTQAAAANGIPEDKIMPILSKELGMKMEDINNILSSSSNALPTIGSKFNGATVKKVTRIK